MSEKTVFIDHLYLYRMVDAGSHALMSQPLISFDAAGTLIQVRVPVGQTYAETALRHGVKVEAGALKAAFRTAWARMPVPQWPEGECSADDDRGWWRQLVAEVFAEALGKSLAETVMDALFDELYEWYSRPEAWMVFDDVLPVLTDLAKDHRLCVLSNFDGRLRGVLAGHGLDGFFEQVFLSSEIGASKPHARMFQTVLQVMQAEAETSWHVGDDERCDVQGAIENGWRAFAVVRPEQGLGEFVKKVRLSANSSLHAALERVGNPPHSRG